MFKSKKTASSLPAAGVPPVPKPSKTPPTRERYRFLSGLIWDHGLRRPKRHGNWVRLDLNDDFFLQLDSWSQAMDLMRGDKEQFSEVIGWKASRHIYHLGIDFGGYEPQVSAAILEEIIESAQAAIAAR
jgi:hypothetical protein